MMISFVEYVKDELASSDGLHAGNCFVEDFLENQGAQVGEKGRELRLNLSKADLDLTIAFPDCASWQIPALEVQQEGFSHGGFCGTIKQLLEKVKFDVKMMRSAYPMQIQIKMDEFLAQVEQFLRKEREVVAEAAILVIHDPAGLCFLLDDPQQCCDTSTFFRTFTENDELGLITKEFELKSDSERIHSAQEVAELLSGKKRIVALTGAGISVESGIPPFRTPNEETSSSDAIWAKFDANKMTVQGFNTNEEITKQWWVMKRDLFTKIGIAKPNPAHRFFGFLQERGQLGHIITQNIDSLHQRGTGVSMQKVFELHGHMRGLICANNQTQLNRIPVKDGSCKFRLAEDGALVHLKDIESEEIPRCPQCGSALRTETIMFGQPMAENAFLETQEIVSQADCLIVIGTSLIVRPANELPAVALRLGIPLIIINKDETKYDQFSMAVVRESAGVFLDQVQRCMF